MTESTTMAPVPLSHTVSGSGPLIVLIHGITEDHRSFDPLLPLLVPHYTVLTVDLRGHGSSPAADSYGLDEMAADVAAVVAAVAGDGTPADASARGAATGPAAPLVIGHSLGGFVATAYAARRPVRGVVNIDQSLDLAGMQGQIKPLQGLLRGPECAAVVAGMFAQMAGLLPQAEQDRLAAIRHTVPDVLLGIWAPLFEFSSEELERTVDALVTPAVPYPYLTIQGITGPPDYPDWLRRRISGAVVLDWGNIGHYPHLCEPERFVATVLAADPGAVTPPA